MRKKNTHAHDDDETSERVMSKRETVCNKYGDANKKHLICFLIDSISTFQFIFNLSFMIQLNFFFCLHNIYTRTQIDAIERQKTGMRALRMHEHLVLLITVQNAIFFFCNSWINIEIKVNVIVIKT